ncbi:MAG TPA: SDR family NAD(P)-dependent oxidoreductase [Dehalococcoidia bacterium]|nr:SDR family NAD(P)-dependent oxidoreductase [Dehalococcoidia bacterium]
MTLDNRRRVLITGGAGFIGANLADRLIADGAAVTIFDNLSRRGAAQNLAWLKDSHPEDFRFVQGDICDAGAIGRAMQGMQAVYHLAAQTAVTTSVTDPRSDFEINAAGTFNVLEAARHEGDNPIFIYASTNKVYGGMEHLEVVEEATRYTYKDLPRGASENEPLDFHSPYGCSKGAADQYVRDYHRIYGLRTVVFRQSCIYGPRQMGVEDQGWVAWFVIAAVLGKRLTIYGDGKQVRDLLYIDDLVEAYRLAGEHIEQTAGRIYNIGGGAANTMSVWTEFRPLLERALGRRVPEPAFADWRPGDQKVFFCDTSRAERDFGWRPKVGVEEGVHRLAEWVQANQSLFTEE